MQFNQWFSDCIGHCLLTNVDNKKLKEYCLALKKSKQGEFSSYAHNWHTLSLDHKTPILKKVIMIFGGKR